MILVITGSRHGFPRLWPALDALVLRIGVPDEVRVREQVGVDQDARAWCRARGYPFAADMSLPLPDCYHDGNRRMVTGCGPTDHIAGFPCPRSRGTWHCLRCGVAVGMQAWVADARTGRIARWRA